ncbi:hypothetical protein NPIL_627761, partial [Nephila pilipes]
LAGLVCIAQFSDPWRRTNAPPPAVASRGRPSTRLYPDGCFPTDVWVWVSDINWDLSLSSVILKKPSMAGWCLTSRHHVSLNPRLRGSDEGAIRPMCWYMLF